MPQRQPISIAAFTATSCLGRGIAPLRKALATQTSGLAPCRFLGIDFDTWAGEAAGLDDPALAMAFGRANGHPNGRPEDRPHGRPDDRSHDHSDGRAYGRFEDRFDHRFDCRNNRLALIGLQQDGFEQRVRAAAERHGPGRIGVFLGSSTSGLLSTELAYRERTSIDAPLPAWLDYAGTHNMYSLAAFVRQHFGLAGPTGVLSVACASSAKVFATAARALAAGLVDAAIVGGVDTLCLTTLYGFGSLELLSKQPCRPYDAARDGISLGEAAAFVLLERANAGTTGTSSTSGGLWLVGWGETSDAHHMSSPHPQGAGAGQAMRDALEIAGLAPAQIDYVNLHGTATPSNDAAEDAAVFELFGDGVPVSSTKGLHGHALGAAGGLEAVVALLALEDGLMPAGRPLADPDPALRSAYLRENRRAPLRRIMSNSFGFGGANCALVFARQP
ncbi:MAG TPA: beta-ketoacyl-[acyl-carrier-protein] synthase family protein [Burkholderiaceae bacterium]|nr:beta-ketoacyl-[acyl-carrier-protein] synthase family protein [Burkholderiaceae bacterium]